MTKRLQRYKKHLFRLAKSFSLPEADVRNILCTLDVDLIALKLAMGYELKLGNEDGGIGCAMVLKEED